MAFAAENLVFMKTGKNNDVLPPPTHTTPKIWMKNFILLSLLYSKHVPWHTLCVWIYRKNIYF